ncbi:tellurite resistance/C4-dicarboxylate transporter family protein [Streptomyces sp. NPDC001508]|uniref:tellurite resistance/C4-dicarboxylate transporter family protein n=1 Tax=Streptomyces sp. NPDC001508 TaxID=3154656 RepID=UPI003330D6E3
MPGTSPLRAWWAQRPPAAGAAVMATGIVSLGLYLTGYEVLSLIALALSCVAWAALAVDFVAGMLRDRERWPAEARRPDALTAVAATTVLGTRISVLGGHTLAAVLLALASVLWPVLLFLAGRGLRRRMPGTVFLICVATQGLAVLGATLAAAESTAWLAHTALVLFWLGLALYPVALARFDARQLLDGAGDHWVLAGALAISALAGAKLITAGGPALYLWNEDDKDVLHSVTVGLLALDLACCAVLVLAEMVRPRPRYDVRRWSTVFPMGMTAVASLAGAAAVGTRWLWGLGHVLLWVAVAAWLAVAAGAVVTARAGIRAAGRA